MICPLIDTGCLREGCAWWNGDIEACSVWVIADAIDKIEDRQP